MWSIPPQGEAALSFASTDSRRCQKAMIAVEVDERVARKLFGKKISIRYYNAIFEHTVGEVNGPYWFKVDVGSSSDEPLEEENT